jgi:hypothetical protein
MKKMKKFLLLFSIQICEKNRDSGLMPTLNAFPARDANLVDVIKSG